MNILNKIYLPNTLHEIYALVFYNGYGETLNILLKIFLTKHLEDIEHPILFAEWGKY